MTLLSFSTPDQTLAIRFAVSPAWETLAAVRTLTNQNGHRHHGQWLTLARGRLGELDVEPLVALLARRGFVPDFLTPPPGQGSRAFDDELAEVLATSPEQVASELGRSLETTEDEANRQMIASLLEDPVAARDLLADRLQMVWNRLVEPYWPRIRELLKRDVERRTTTLTRHGMRRVLDELHPSIGWSAKGLVVHDSRRKELAIDSRGLVLMPSAYCWASVVSIVDEPWQPTIVYPARGIAALWRAASPPPEAVARVLGRTRARVLASLTRPTSTTTLAQLLELSGAGTSRHITALRDAGLVTGTRSGYEVLYKRTTLGTALLRGRS